MKLQEYLRLKRKGEVMGRLSKKAKKRLKKRLMNSRLGRWKGEGKDRIFIPLSTKETEQFVKMVKNDETLDDEIDVQDNLRQETWWERHFGQLNGGKGFGVWVQPRRAGLEQKWWGKEASIKFNAKAYAKMVYYCQAVSTEVSGFGKVKEIRNDKDEIERIDVVDVLLLKQECTHGHTQLDEENMSNFLFQLAKKGEDPSQWRLWWHTHNDFTVFWSGIDDGTVSRIIKAFGGYLVATCINKKCEIVGRIDQINDKGVEQSADVTVAITPIKKNNWKSSCIRQAKRLVTERTYVTTPYKGVTYGKGFFSKRGKRGLNVMSNEDRRRQDIPQDPSLDDFEPKGIGMCVPERSIHGYPLGFFNNGE